MVSDTKAASDTYLHHQESVLSLVPLKLISSINSDQIRKYRSGNNISSREKNLDYPFEESIKSINDNYQRFSNNNLINTHFPIANIQQDSTMMNKRLSSFQSPTVPNQAGTFIHRLVNKFFSISNTKNNLSRNQRKQINRPLSNDSHTILNLAPKKRRRQRLKTTRNNHINKPCDVCRKYRNCFSILPMEYPSQSPLIFNTNATTIPQTHSVSNPQPSLSFQKLRPLNTSQSQTIASAVELIFDTLISNYHQTDISNMPSF